MLILSILVDGATFFLMRVAGSKSFLIPLFRCFRNSFTRRIRISVLLDEPTTSPTLEWESSARSSFFLKFRFVFPEIVHKRKDVRDRVSNPRPHPRSKTDALDRSATADRQFWLFRLEKVSPGHTVCGYTVCAHIKVLTFSIIAEALNGGVETGSMYVQYVQGF